MHKILKSFLVIKLCIIIKLKLNNISKFVKDCYISIIIFNVMFEYI